MGVLYDLLVPQHDQEPWPLTLHVRNYPAPTLVPCDGEASLRGALLNSLKEAACVCTGSAHGVHTMSSGARDDLWAAVAGADVPLYRRVLGSLQLERGAREGGPWVPVRLFVRSDGGGYLSSYTGIRSTSRPLAALNPDRTPATLRGALLPLLAPCVPGAAPPSAADVEARVARVYVAGASPPLDCSLEELHRESHAPDYFLYIVVHLLPGAAQQPGERAPPAARPGSS